MTDGQCSVLWAPTIITLLVLSQAASVATSLFLSFWTDQSLGLSQTSYMGIYIGLGGATAITSTAVSYAFRYANCPLRAEGVVDW
jgi:ATP-binding cassette subfamily C (CFTR/MRP) protein 1